VKPHRTINTSVTFLLPGGTAENNLPAYAMEDEEGNIVICSVWVPTDDERKKIANGWNPRLILWGDQQPPVAIDLTDEKLDEKNA
jgi:hypothetical protein